LIYCGCAVSAAAQPLAAPWVGYGHDAQHSGVSAVASQPFNRIKWRTAVDAVNQGADGPLYIHYGTPVVTAANTVLLPLRTSANNAFQVNAFNGATGAQLYALTTDYVPPPHNWIPSYGTTLGLGYRYFYPGAGGTVYYRDSPDSLTGDSGQLAFYGLSTYQSNESLFQNNVFISTPITADRYGNIYFGFVVTGNVTLPGGGALASGLARISVAGAGSWVSATALAGGDGGITQVQTNCAPAITPAGTTVYVAVNGGGASAGYLASANAETLAPAAHARLIDPSNGQNAVVSADSSAAPTIGPDGDVYFGVLEFNCPGACSNHDRGWLLHFNSALSTSKLPGAFGWDTTAAIVSKSLIPSYRGTSSYLLLTKYNDYKEFGSGLNYVAITDPNHAMTDFVTGVQVMSVVMEQLGPTIDGSRPAVREWCINSAAIDPETKSAIVNSEDGVNYKWNLAANTLARMPLTNGVSEAYTPTVIGPDGTVYAINDATLFAIGQ
jgi:hypothetical protein